MPDHILFNHEIFYWEYWIARIDEIDIEKELLHCLENVEKDDEWLQTLIRDLKKSLCIIDKYKISGDYDDYRKDLRRQSRFQELEEPPTLKSVIESRDREVIEGLVNLTNGLKSPDSEERAKYQAVFEKCDLGKKTASEIKELLVMLKMPKSRNQGGRPPLCPPWRNDVDVMDAMRLDENSGLSIPKAASKHALAEGKAHDDSRAKRFDRLYREKMKLRT